jgi:hypothetical protein
MRMLAQARKDRVEEIENERRDEERKERLKRDAADEEERGRNKANKVKKRKDASRAREERPLTHGAHGLAPQDGSNLGESLRKASLRLERKLPAPLLPYLIVPVTDRYISQTPHQFEIPQSENKHAERLETTTLPVRPFHRSL